MLYSSNWAGAVLQNPPSPSETYTAVTATFTAPNPTATGQSENNTFQAASVWVGIDGDTYTAAILQTGVDFYISGNQKNYVAWYEWYPDYAYSFDLSIDAGDVVVARVESLSSSRGVAAIENRSTGKSSTTTLSAPGPHATLGGQNAEWIVEDFDSNGHQVALVNFDWVDFTGAEALAAGGRTLGVGNATLLSLEKNNRLLTRVSVVGNRDMVVEYLSSA